MGLGLGYVQDDGITPKTINIRKGIFYLSSKYGVAL